MADEPITVRFRRLTETARVPTRGTSGSAGWDLYAADPCTMESHGGVDVPTGLAVEIPPGYVGLIRDRSSWGHSGITVLAGVVDSDYRGEVRVILRDLAGRTRWIFPGERMAQLVILPVPEVEWVEADDLGPSARGTGGFGSTGGMVGPGPGADPGGA